MLFKPLDARQIHLVLLSQKMPPSPLAAVGTGRGNRASPPAVPQAFSVPRKVLPISAEPGFSKLHPRWQIRGFAAMAKRWQEPFCQSAVIAEAHEICGGRKKRLTFCDLTLIFVSLLNVLRI